MIDFASARRKMVDNQLRTAGISDHRLLKAIGDIPREVFVPIDRRDLAYADLAHPLGGGRALATPAAFARLAQLAEIQHADRVLDVGPASGYSSAVLAHLCADVVALESDPVLAATARKNLTSLGISNVRIADAAVDGSARVDGPFDVVLIEGALDDVPSAFFPALAEGGRLVALVRSGATAIAHVYVKSGGEVAGRIEFNATLPPLDTAPRPVTFVF